jgi:hypothetical protein
MSERRLLDVVTERLSLGRRSMRILRHRTARWFLPPVRQATNEPLEELPRLRLLPTTAVAARRSGPSTN